MQNVTRLNNDINIMIKTAIHFRVQVKFMITKKGDKVYQYLLVIDFPGFNEGRKFIQDPLHSVLTRHLFCCIHFL
jgi:hypothetical protein